MSKNIVVCFDGTSNEYGKHNTNVVKIFESILVNENQDAFYDPGVGTISFLERRLGRLISIGLGLAFGYGIRKNIEEGYEYLMDVFEPEDKVFIFGFSRGAYTARALAGMIRQFGILRKGSGNLIPYVTKMYFKKDKDKDTKIIEGFKDTYSNVCKPHFIGLWDTVGALGPNLSKRFPDLKLNTDIKHGYQAISIDEKRRPFKIVFWDEKDKKRDQTIEQVWFPGVHSEVGGGCSKNGCSLSDIAFAWMMDKAYQCDLKLKEGWQNSLNQDPGVEIHDSCYFFPWVIFGMRKKREIPENAIIHKSVLDRINKRKDYQPKLPKKMTVTVSESYKNNTQSQ